MMLKLLYIIPEMKLKLYGFILLLICHFLSVAQHASALPDSLFIIQDSVLIPTKSGIPLSAILVRKKGTNTPKPAILFYYNYYRDAKDAILGKRSAARDYVGVVVYPRGIKTNLNHYMPFENEGVDVYDVIEWISQQPWCNGAIGMYGGSYTGYAQWAAVKKLHPALKTIVPQVAVMPGYDFPMENNVPLSHILSWSNDDVYKNKPLPRSLPFDYFNSGTAFRKLDSLAGSPNPIFQKWLAHEAYDLYWQSMVPTPEEYKRITIPVLTTTGYYDGSQIGALSYFRNHLRYNPSAEHYLVIGPYDHISGQNLYNRNLMGYIIDSVAQVNMRDLAFEWLDYILKGKPKPALLKDKVNFQVMGTNTWRHVSSLQVACNDTLQFYLNNGSLTSLKPGTKASTLQIVDFNDRLRQNNYYTPEICFDSLDRSNGLLFVSPVFDYSFEINGSFTGQLLTRISKKDMDVSLALYEQQADGKYFFLARYVGRASYAKDNSKRQFLKPGKKEIIPFSNTRFVSKKIAKGSRLVVLLNINKHPFEVLNYGTGKPVADETIKDAGAPLRIQWLGESYIKIPVKK